MCYLFCQCNTLTGIKNKQPVCRNNAPLSIHLQPLIFLFRNYFYRQFSTTADNVLFLFKMIMHRRYLPLLDKHEFFTVFGLFCKIDEYKTIFLKITQTEICYIPARIRWKGPSGFL